MTHSQSRADHPYSISRWALILLLAILLHLALAEILRWSFPFWDSSHLQKRTEVSTTSSQQLEALREKIKRKEAERLLLSKDRSPIDPSVSVPKDARYFSDRNRVVEKETRAKNAQSTVPSAPSVPTSPSTPAKIPLSKLGLSRGPKLKDSASPAKNSPKANRSQQNSFSPGADQYLGDDALAEGSENLLNTRESIFYSFYARLQEAIGPVWESSAREVPRKMRLQEGDYRTDVLFELSNQGKLTRLGIVGSSGVDAFDQAAIKAIQKVAEFPNPPKDLLEKDGKIRINLGFVFRLSRSGAVQWLPPQ